MVELKEAVMSDAEFAQIIYHSPHELLGMSEDVRSTLWAEGIQKHRPDIMSKFAEAAELTKIASKYPAYIRRIYRNFYNPAIAELAKKRVTSI